MTVNANIDLGCTKCYMICQAMYGSFKTSTQIFGTPLHFLSEFSLNPLAKNNLA